MAAGAEPHEGSAIVNGMRMRRVGLLCAAAAVVAVSLGTVSTTSASPRRDLEQVQRQVRDLEMKAAAAERAQQAQGRLDQITAELGGIERRADRERDELRIVTATIEDIARAAYASGGVDPTLAVLMAEDPTEFLAQAAVMSQLEMAQLGQLRAVQTTRLRLAQTEAMISDRKSSATQVRDEMAQAEEDESAQLAAAEAVLGDLQEEERQRLAQLAEDRRQQQLAAAAAATQAWEQEGPAPDSSGSGAAESGGGFSGGTRAQAAVQYALSQVGDPYSFSANPPSSWDCSKLTAAAWAQGGVGLTALSYTQWDQTQRVPVSDIQPGDLVFYFGLGAHHVAIYIGNGKMVSASNPSDGVEIIDFLGPWYGERFSGVGRVIG